MSNLKVGLFGARSTNSGLGIQTKDFFDYIKPYRTLVVDISKTDGKPTYPERFQGKGVETHEGFPTAKFVQDWVDRNEDLDIIVCVEIPYNYHLFAYARMKGIRTVLIYNYEFLDYLNQPTLPYPDLLIAPSIWNLKEAERAVRGKTKIEFIPVPVSLTNLQPVIRKEAKTFIHVAGYKLFEDRNGTQALLDAIPLVKSKDVKFLIYSQHQTNLIDDPRVEYRGEVKEHGDLYKEGDVLVLPRRYGGLSLQCNEAMASGMPVLMPVVDPNIYLLHPACLFKHAGLKKIKTRTEIDCYNIFPRHLAEKIDEFANLPAEKIAQISEFHLEHGKLFSWDVQKFEYLNSFEMLCGSVTE